MTKSEYTDHTSCQVNTAIHACPIILFFGYKNMSEHALSTTPNILHWTVATAQLDNQHSHTGGHDLFGNTRSNQKTKEPNCCNIYRHVYSNADPFHSNLLTSHHLSPSHIWQARKRLKRAEGFFCFVFSEITHEAKQIGVAGEGGWVGGGINEDQKSIISLFSASFY